jgi:hypothetical protein
MINVNKIKSAFLIAAFCGGSLLALGGSQVAAADDGDHFVGSSCQDVRLSSNNVWHVCDDQWDSINLPGYRSHIINATPTDDCPSYPLSVRLRASMQAYGDGTQSTVTSEVDYCSPVNLTVSGDAGSSVNVSLLEYNSDTTNLVFSPM